MIRLSKIVLLTFLCLVLFGFVVVGGGGGIIEAGFTLLFGWASFLKRTLPKISFNWDIAGMAMICVVGIFFVGHSFLDRLTRHIAASRGQTWQWPRKWTYCGLIAIGLLFLVGMSVGGTVHQIGWIASSPEPMFVSKSKAQAIHDAFVTKQFARDFQLMPADSNVAAVRSSLWNSSQEKHYQNRRGESLLQSLHVLFVVEGEKVKGLIVFPRNTQSKARRGGYYATAGEIQGVPAAELPALLQRHRDHLISF